MCVFGELEVIFGTEPKEGVAGGQGAHGAPCGVSSAFPSVTSTLDGGGYLLLVERQWSVSVLSQFQMRVGEGT